jgi:hypothetical protein
MQARNSKALALLGGMATLALGSTFMLRLGMPKPPRLASRCAPRLLELERAVCDAPAPPQPLRIAAAAAPAP